MEGIQAAAFIAGIVIGCVGVGGARFVWIRHRVFGMGGSVLSVVGVAMLGLSIWSGIRIEIDREGLRAEVTRLQEQVDAVVEANETVVREVIKAVKKWGRTQFSTPGYR